MAIPRLNLNDTKRCGSRVKRLWTWSSPLLDAAASDIVTVVEHPIQSRFDEFLPETSPQPTQGGRVVDLVSQDRSPRLVIEKEVTVIPVGKGAAHLSIRKESPRFVLGMLGDPTQWDRPKPHFQDHPTSRAERIPPFN